MDLRNQLLEEIMPRVEKPSRYIGTEMNSVHKDPASVDLRVCLFFPDLYELGLGNLGLHILYNILNGMDGVWCERGYTPAPDMEAMLRARGLPLFMQESKEPLRHADCIGFTLQSELTFTNVLNAIDLAGLPVRSSARDEDSPLIFAGGPVATNPEPMAAFIDFFVIGDGEDVVVEIAALLRELRGRPRSEKLAALAQVQGCYVPALYPMETLADGAVVPMLDAPPVVKRITPDMNKAPFPTRYIVPYTQLVHDGIGLEVLRGCTQGCRFCHAGMVTRPVRERSLESIDRLMEETLANTGLENVSLVSLSTCDYSRARSLAKQAADRAHPENVSVSLPSLRLDSFSVDLADQVSGVRRSGLTFAPEAGSERLRKVINKTVTSQDLLFMAEQAFARGWTHIKTYFMIGLPTETDEDVEAIADLCFRTLEVGRMINPKAKVRTGVSTFVPKPLTPFQWAEQIGIEETTRRQNLLAEAFRREPAIHFGKHTPETSFIEGLLARAGRRAADLIEAAWRRGARLETWDEHVNLDAWMEAIEETGYDAPGQLRARGLDERLPWDHIDIMIPKTWLREEWERATRDEPEPDCRSGHCNKCGVIFREGKLCGEMLRVNRRGRREDAQVWDAQEPQPEPATPAMAEPKPTPEPVQRIRFRIGRKGEVRLLGHLEMQDAWIRALRRAKAPLAYSQGFHAHAKINFAAAAPLGEESEGDYMDVLLTETLAPADILGALAASAPPGFLVLDAWEEPLRAASLMSSVAGFRYAIEAKADPGETEKRIQAILASGEAIVPRKVKSASQGKRRGRGKRKAWIDIDILPMIETLRARPTGNGVAVEFTTHSVENRLAKPKDIAHLLGWDAESIRVTKLDTILASEGARTRAG